MVISDNSERKSFEMSNVLHHNPITYVGIKFENTKKSVMYGLKTCEQM